MHLPRLIAMGILRAAIPFLALVPAVGFANCPTTQLYCNATSRVLKDASGLLTCADSYGTGRVSYDLIQGTLSANVSQGWSLTSSVSADDDFVVSGVPDGTPLAYRARLKVSVSQTSYGDNCCFGAAGSQLHEGTNYDQANAPGGTGYHSRLDTLEVPITHPAGETFRLSMYMWANGVETGSGFASGTLEFVDLPEGAVITSCRGFRSTGVTATKRVSWGELKIRYR